MEEKEQKKRKGKNGGLINVGGVQPGAGRPKHLVSEVTNSLLQEGYKPVTAGEVQTVYKVLLQMTEPDIKAIIANEQQPMLLRIVARAMLSKKGFEVIEKMMDRSHGRAANILSLQRTEDGAQTEGKTNEGQNFTGINIVVVGGSRPAVHSECEIEQLYGGGD